MPITLSFNAKQIEGLLASKAVKAVDKTLKSGLEFAKTISPTDTEEYINSHKTEGAENLGGTIVGAITNDAEHAMVVELGVKGRVFNYHKGPSGGPRRVIYTGVGNRTYTRTIDHLAPILQQNLINGS